MVNPYVYTREIEDPRVFAGRKLELVEIEREIKSLAAGQPMTSLALIGVRRVGKTSTLLRVSEICERHSIFPVMITLKEMHCSNPWEFWREVLGKIVSLATERDIVTSDPKNPLTFWIETAKPDSRDRVECHLHFEETYKSYTEKAGLTSYPTNYVLEHDITMLLKDAILKNKYTGLLLMLDEAQKLQESPEAKHIKESLRQILSRIRNIGLILAGLENLEAIFNDYNDAFYQQGHIIPIANFTTMDDERECALLPLSKAESKLMSPMTIDYLALLSQGMPNYIQLICHAIYERYMENKQNDLNLTMDIMENLLDVMERDASIKGRLSDLVNSIKDLNSIDLETLYNLARYPGWTIEDMIDLDESFRGEVKSDKVIERRRRIVNVKRELFTSRGLMADDGKRFVLSGDEYVHLYLRFWYEVMKYGELSRQIVVGRGPQTPFGEKADKIADAVSWDIRHLEGVATDPGIVISIFHPDSRDRGQLIVERVLRRYMTFKEFEKEGVPFNEDCMKAFFECMEVCKFVDKPGKYLLICLSVRNRIRPRELIQIEIYHRVDVRNPPILDLGSLNEQAKYSGVAIEGHAQTVVELPDLTGLFSKVGAQPNDYLDELDFVDKWLIDSIQHLVHKKELEKEEKDEQEKDTSDGKWLEHYEKDHVEDAIKYLTESIALCLGSDRKKLSKFYNDRGYIYSTAKHSYRAARNDLELAFDYHYSHLSLTILNLSYLDIMQDDYDGAIARIEDVLLITHGREAIEAGYLRTILPKTHLDFLRQIWEHKPANTIEVCYIQLAYATWKHKNGGFEKALEVLNEGLELLPRSIWLKHALARYYILHYQSNIANPIYEELSNMRIPSPALRWEIDNYLKVVMRRAKKSTDREY